MAGKTRAQKLAQIAKMESQLAGGFRKVTKRVGLEYAFRSAIANGIKVTNRDIQGVLEDVGYFASTGVAIMVKDILYQIFRKNLKMQKKKKLNLNI